MVWVTKKAGTTSYVYDMLRGETAADTIKRHGWDSGLGCALSSKETSAIFISFDEFDVEPVTP